MLAALPLGLPNLAAEMPATVVSVLFVTVMPIVDVDSISVLSTTSEYRMGFIQDEDTIPAISSLHYEIGISLVVGRGPYRDYGRPIAMSFYKQRITIGTG